MLRTELIRPLPELLRANAARFGDKVAFHDAHRSVSYAELEQRTGRLAGHLVGLRLQPGDRAAILLGNRVEMVESYLAITRASAVGVPINPRVTEPELAYLLDDSGARLVITDAAHLDLINALLPERVGLKVVVVDGLTVPDGAPAGAVAYEVLACTEPSAPARDDLALDDPAWMLYTSGTTGRPKGVLSTQRSCLWSVAACYVPVPGLSADDRVLWPLPLFHSLAHIFCVLGVTAVGATARIVDGFDADEVLRVIREDGSTFVAGVPTMYHHLVRAARESGFVAPELRMCLVGGAITTAALRHSFEEVFGAPLLDAYGSTETCGSITINWPTGARVEGSCGLPVPGLGVRLVDPETGLDVADGEQGEVWVKGPSVMLGYHNRPEETAAAFKEGWFRTGDLARRDEAGYFTVTGRIKELIIRGGENIHPGEVEEVLREVPGVADVAVVGKPHEVLGEVPVAFLVPAPEGFDPEELFAACREKLSYFKVPEELYEIDRIPRTASGKITRHVLLELPARQRASSSSHYETLFRLDWLPLPSVQARPAGRGSWTVAGPDAVAVAEELRRHDCEAGAVANLAELRAAVAAGGPAPEVALLTVRTGVRTVEHLAENSQHALRALTEQLADWLADQRVADTRLAVLTRRAVAVSADPAEQGARDLVQAPLWGALRSLQNEHPNRLVLVDLDDDTQSTAMVVGALATGESQSAVREGVTLLPRLARVSVSADLTGGGPLDPRGTVLITGADRPAAADLARHLTAAHGARKLLLISDHGRADRAAARLRAELAALGAAVKLAACDLADRDALAAVLATVRTPLAMVVHTPAEPDAADESYRVAVTCALNLYDLTAEAGTVPLVFNSSVDGVLGASGRPHHAALSVFLDTLAERRRSRGLPATSLAWGPTDRVGAAAHILGIGSLTTQQATAAFDGALQVDGALVIALKLEALGLGEGTVPALLRGLIDTPARPTSPDEATAGDLIAALTGLSPADRHSHLLDLVRAVTAEVGVLVGGDVVAADKAFKELGFTSVTAVALRNRLVEETGLTLAATVAFDHPSPRAVARHLHDRLFGAQRATARTAALALDEPIAIVGMSVRLPGGVESPEDLWRLVEAGGDAVSGFPTDRGWDPDLYDPSPDAPGKSYARDGGFLGGVAEFDAEFFGISPREALAMDPQQRLMLEASWEAIESAGIDPTGLRGSTAGVFTGLMHHDYAAGLTHIPDGLEGYLGIGTAGSVASGRVSYTLGLEGPSVTLDTACSSSLVAVHLAVQALRQGECSMALAGGVAVMATPGVFVEFSRQRGLAADGRIKAFAGAADGTAWAEGVGVVVLERLSEARRLGHRVLAVVRGSAVNQDGASNGLTAPNGPSQERVIRQALANARLSAADVDVVEAHGTGTTLGDPIEAQALLATYGQDRPVERPLWLGSLKSNIGHAQAAAGVAGVIKMVLALRRGVLPRTLHVDEPTPKVDWSAGAVELLTEAREWPETGRPRRAGVSSFGVSGTNAHVILEQAPDTGPVEGARAVALPAHDVPLPWVLSGKSVEALRGQAVKLADFVEADPALDPADVAFSLTTSRASFEESAVVVAAGRDALLAGLRALGSGVPDSAVVSGAAVRGKLAVLFTGQGSQVRDMGLGLYSSFPVFAAAFDAVCAELDPLLERPLREVIASGEQLDETGFTQPALFAVEVALFRLLESFGVRPDFLAGHSVGELAAAHVSGVLGLRDAAVLVAARGRLMQALPAGGVMVAVQAGEEEVGALLTGGVSVAAVNGPDSVVLSGDRVPVERVVSVLRERGRKTRALTVSHAFHSAHMDGMLEDFGEVAASLTYGVPAVRVVSNVTGGLAEAQRLGDPRYWVEHVRGPVRFLDGVRELRRQGVTAFLEVGPGGVLTAMAQACVADDAGESVFVPALRGRGEEARSFVTALARLHVHGTTVDWSPLLSGAGRIDLPTYAFQRERYWLEAVADTNVTGAGLADPGHPLLGAVTTVSGSGVVVASGVLSLRAQPWLAGHVVAGSVVVPGSVLVELAVRAGDEVGAGVVGELVVEAPLVLAQRGSLRVQVVVEGVDGGGRLPVAVYAAEGGGEWVRHASGFLTARSAGVLPVVEGGVWPPAGAVAVDLGGFYEGRAEAGIAYGALFRGLRAAWTSGGEVFAEVVLPEGTVTDGFALHPALLDAALHASEFLPGRSTGTGTYLPFAWSDVTVHATGAEAARVRITARGTDGFGVEVADRAGNAVASVGRLSLRELTGGLGVRRSDALFRVEWVPLPLGEAAAPGDVVVADLTEGGGVRPLTVRALGVLQEFLGSGSDGRLVVLTRGVVDDPAVSAVWGLVRSAQSENPGRIVLVDTDRGSGPLLDAALASGEPQLLLREGTVAVPRLVRADQSQELAVPAGAEAWHLDVTERGTLENLAMLPDAVEPLESGQVRIAVRAAGVNFRDVLIVLGMYPGDATLGGEGAGVVLEVGPDVTGLQRGDRVMGLLVNGFGPQTVTDRRNVVRMPAGWSFAQAASAPIAFVTAYYGLRDRGGLSAGESVLVHAAAGGVGSAAVQLARHFGATVFGTASTGKWDALRATGLDDQHIGNSRTLEFRERFLAATDGRGVDVVLDALAGEFVDASLELLPRGGRFLEMGKTDIRDAAEVAAVHPGVAYQAFDLVEAGPDRVQEILLELVELFERGVLTPLPLKSWDVRRAPDAFRHLSQARHVGKVVLTVPRPLDPEGTVLVSGLGTLGALVARHLVTEHGVRNLVLTSRRGRDGAGADGLAAELAALGASVTIESCDTADRDAVAAVLAAIPAERPLTAVIHTAGVVDDGVLTALTPQRLDTVFRPKVDAVRTLDELTRDADLAAFVIFSSAAGVLGNPGQANYAAANAYLDGLAARISAEGRPAVSLAWGFWSEASTMTAGLDTATLQRNKRDGMVGLGAEDGMRLLDLGLRAAVPALVPAKLDLAALRARAAAEPLPALLRGLVRSGRQSADNTTAAAGTSVADQLAGLAADDQERFLLDLVRRHAATVLGHTSGDSIEAGRAFKEAGFDSLTAVELRNRLTGPTGVRLPATLIFDYPTPQALAKYLRDELVGDAAAALTGPVRGTVAAGTDEPIAIVAMSCRFPGEVNTPEDLWDLLLRGADVMSGFPTNRGWDLEHLFDPDPESPGTSYVSRGAFLHDAGEFDAEFFGISPREALAMDPQQRLLLEASWEAIERAGIDPTTLRGTSTGVFTGLISHDYAHGLHQSGAELEGYRLTGAAGSVASGRVSYALGLEGPAISVDTACSSSLVSLHMAVQALRQGEISMALAGGVMVMATPDTFVEFSRQRGLAVDGRVKAFAGSADGTAWSEGIGVLVVERLSDAERLGHPVLAVVRGSAVNQDGASNGLSAPNGPSQQRVIRQALANARLTTADVDAVEAHGTGTTLGDPIEAQALLATYGQDRPADRPLWLGSVKSNIGHAQGAAGVAGVIKMVLALRHGVLPKTLNVDEPTPKVDWSAGAVELLTEAREWPETGRPRRAGVSSFGVSGTNAHVIIEQAPGVEAVPRAGKAPTQGTPLPWLLSARTAAALRGQAARLAAFVEAEPQLDPADVAHSLATTRAALDVRAAVVPSSRSDALVALTALAAGESAPNLVTGTAGVDGRTVFVFPGQGSQWVGMGAELLDSSPVFAARMAECAAALADHTDWSLLDVIRQAEGAPSLDRVDVVQPVSFAMMVSLAELWRSYGIVPDAVVGHSQGEIAASCVAGVLSLADAAKVVALRSRAIAVGLAGKGGMMSVALPEAEVEARLADGLELAAVNGPTSAVVAGEPTALDALYEELVAEGVRARRVPVDYASHTSQVELIEAELAGLLGGLSPRTAQIPLYSTVTGRWLDGTEMDGGYWYRNLRSTVRFAEATDALLAQGHRVFVEVSSHPVLTMAVQELIDQGDGVTAVAVGSLRRDDGGLDRLLLSLAELQICGAEVDDVTLYAGADRIDLPTYAFQRERFWWAESVVAGDASAFGLVSAGHPLLGAVTTVSGSGVVVASGVLSLRAQPWLAGHVVAGSVVVPGSVLVELAVRAGDEVGAGVVGELVVEAPLVLAERGSLRVQVVVEGADGEGRFPVAVYAAEGGGEWVRHASGFLTAEAAETAEVRGLAGVLPVVEGGVWPPAGAVAVDLGGFYEGRAEAGIAYGPVFRGLRAAWTSGGEVFAEVVLPEGTVTDGFALHPALLDAALHAGVFLPGRSTGTGTYLPFAWSDVTVHATGAEAARVRITARGTDGFGVEVADRAGNAVASVGRLSLRELTGGLGVRRSDALFRVEWVPLPLGEAAAPGDVVVADLTEGGGVRPLTVRALGVLQEFLGSGSDGRLVVLTRGVADDPAVSAVWGLVRSAQSENPDRIVLVDTDEVSGPLLDAALASGEPQLLLREGSVAVPRLVRVESAGDGVPGFDPEGTVLVSGLGTLGALVARHLVVEHGVSRLLLTSRRGGEGAGVGELVAELAGLGASVRVEACDMADREAVARLLGGVPAEYPLTGVVHTAGVLDDGLVGSLTPERLDAVFRPKVDAAVNLDELTRGLDLAAFVLFSSAAGVFGTPGQANYAAANAFLDGLAVRRRQEGLPATSLAWGLWAEHTGMTGHLDDVDLQRSKRGGTLGLPNDEGVRLFDAALASGAPVLVPAKLDLAGLSRNAGSESVPPLLRGLVRPGRRAVARTVGTTGADTLAQRLVGLPEDERSEFVLELVTGLVTTTLGRSGSAGIDPGQAFKDAGFDSLLAVELRNRLVEATGIRLTATLVFDYATPSALARHLERLLVPKAADEPVAGPVDVETEDDVDLDAVSDDELFDLIDNELGGS